MENMNDIPIKNIYYIILYAWNKVKSHKLYLEEIGLEDVKDINNIMMKLFLEEVGKISKRGLYGKYVEDNYETKFIRGKVDIKESLYLIKPKINCRFDEFSKNNIFNQILKAVLIRISFLKGIDEKDKKTAMRLLLGFDEVENISLSQDLFKSIRYNRLNKDYLFSMDLARLIYENSIPLENDKNYVFLNINRDEETMSSIFENFLFNFYRLHTNYKVSKKRYYWKWTALEESDYSLVPTMKTDVELKSDAEHIIIDAKYYKNAFNNYYETKKFKPNHIYQITSYLERNLNSKEKLRGILIYPSNGYDFYEKFVSNRGYNIEFKTINLNRAWDKIELDLMSIIN